MAPIPDKRIGVEPRYYNYGEILIRSCIEDPPVGTTFAGYSTPRISSSTVCWYGETCMHEHLYNNVMPY